MQLRFVRLNLRSPSGKQETKRHPLLMQLRFVRLNLRSPSGKQETKRRPLATKLTSKAVLAAAATDSAGCHRDSVLSLASVKLNQRLLISSSRDGAIKVWK
ncbi:Serine/threonine-protein kinase VPS15 [Vitis vinifera]|uniref:Serine/threonine-protein kinase VPS15 n=1 Tax=Vitis vinifera TaxID=29760 RepID=A0A438DS27_VITVI|nr:Serine/threonine-protein kinase VPS15 [Vitis vinifera]